MLIYILIVLLIGLGLYIRDNANWSEEVIKRMEQEVVSLRRELREHKERASAYQSDTTTRVAALDKLQVADRESWQSRLSYERMERLKKEKEVSQWLDANTQQINDRLTTLTDKLQAFQVNKPKQVRPKKSKKETDLDKKEREEFIDAFIEGAEKDLLGESHGK